MEQVIVKNLNQLKNQVTAGMFIESNNKLHGTNKRRLILKKNTVSIISKEIIGDDVNKNCSPGWRYNVKIDKNGKEYVEYYTYYQKAKNMRFRENGDIEFLAYDEKRNYGEPLRVPSLDFEVGDPWLVVKIFKN